MEQDQKINNIQESNPEASSKRPQETQQSAEMCSSMDSKNLENEKTKIKKEQEIDAQQSHPESSSNRSPELLEGAEANDNVEMKAQQSEEVRPSTSSAATTRQLINYLPKDKQMNNISNSSANSKSREEPDFKFWCPNESEKIRSFLRDHNPDKSNKFAMLEKIITQLRDARREIYPQMVGTGFNREYILGPNGTTISCQSYDKIQWTTPQAATHQLLHIIFTDENLKNSNLKPAVVDDIILSVLHKVGGKEQLIRAAIADKCADMSKKFKRFTKIESDDE